MSEGVMPRSGSEPQLNASDESLFALARHVAHLPALEIGVKKDQRCANVAVGS